MKDKTLKDFKLLCEKEINLKNENGVNKDHRGSDHTRIILDFHDNFNLPKNCTLQEFADGCYRVKSHKFYHWYELYVGASIEQSEKKLNIHLGFDHGS